jgi:chemotaxis protein CheC
MKALTDIQLDALRELANIGSGTAATALSKLLRRETDVAVPTALALPLADAVDELGPPGTEATAVVLPIVGELDAIVLMLFAPKDAKRICALLGVDPATELGRSALNEVGNIVGTAYINALCALTGLELEPAPPQATTDMLGAIVESVLAEHASAQDVALLLDSDLLVGVEDEACSFSFILVPTTRSVGDLLDRLGLA